MLAKPALLASLFDEKVVAVLQSILQKTEDFGIREVARETKVSIATTYRIIQRLKDLRIITRKKQGKTTLYKINRATDLYTQAYNLIVGPRARPIDVLKQLLNQRIGAENYSLVRKDNKLLLISDLVTEPMHSEISTIVQQRSGIKLPFVSVSKAQYSRMKAMGIF